MKYGILLCLLLAVNAQADVLLIGDSIEHGSGKPGNYGYLPYVKENLANVSGNGRCPYFQDSTTGNTANGGSSKRMAACINIWLASGSYTVVHFNAGMHDVHIAGCGKGQTKHQVELSDYLMNLQTVIDAIRAYGAIPIFATTTPIEGEVDCHFNKDIIQYNAAAVEMMQTQGIQVDDLYSAAYPIQGYLHGSQGIHFMDYGYDFLAHKVMEALQN